MDIKWERRPSNSGSLQERFSLVVLLENVPSGNGNLLVLGAIEERFLKTRLKDTRAFHQGLFWLDIGKKLKPLGLNPKAYDEITLKIAEKVPKPPEDWALWGVTCIPRYDGGCPLSE